MSDPYLYYNNEADAEAHVCIFVTTWQANHVSQHLAEADVNASKLTEFGLSLDEKLANWYSQHDIAEFQDFDQLKDRFV